MTSLPVDPPFRLRARVLTPLAAGGTRYLADGAVDVDAQGRISRVDDWSADGGPESEGPVRVREHERVREHDIRPWLVMPGLVDLHTHIPQLPNAGLGAGLDLLTWLERYTYPLEGRFDVAAAERLGPLAMRSFAAAGTTTVVAYASDNADATEALFRAAEANGIRAVIGLVLMDRAVGVVRGREQRPGREQPGDEEGPGGERGPGDDQGPDADAEHGPDTDAALRASAELAARWNGRDGGRLRYAFTPRFALSCSAGVLRASARLAAETGSLWQTHLSEDPGEMDAVRVAFPEARDYLDVYDRAGALGPGGPRALFAHAIHLSQREVRRLAESGAGVAHCPASNLFLPSGIMPLARYLEAGIPVGLGSDVSGGPDPSIFEVMRVGAYAQHALQALGGESRPRLDPLGWLRLGTIGGAEVLGLADAIGSLEPGMEADMIAVDASFTEPLPGAGAADDPADIVSRLIFRTHPDMVTAAWVRGRLLPR